MSAGWWLRLRIPLLLLAAGGLFLFVDHRLGVAERQREIARTMLAHSNGTVMEAGSLFDSPLYTDASEKHRHLVQLATPKFVRFAAIVDAQGRIVDASPDSLRGRTLVAVLGVDPDAPAEIERRVEGLHSKLIGSSLMFGIGPMGPRPRPDGMRIALAQDIHERLGRAERDAAEQTIPAALVLMVLVTILAFVLDRWLHAPAHRLVETAERITAGDRSARTDLTGAHDLGLVGEAFDRMAATVERSERELREARHLLETVVQSMPVGVSLIDRDNLTVKLSNRRWRDNFMRDLGAKESIREGFRRHRLERPDGSPYPFEEMATPTVIRTGKPVQLSDVVHVMPDGERVPFLVYAEPVSFGTGRDFDAVLVISQDRRELVRLVEELKVWERRFDQVARMTSQIVFEMDFATGTVTRSGDPRGLFGYGPEPDSATALAQWRARLHPDDSPRVQARFDDCLRSGEPFDMEYRFLRRADEWIVVHDRAFFETGGDGQIARMFGSMVDITAQKHLEEQLHQAQKMETVGTLAGGIAHDFNNQLTGVIGHLELLANGLPADDERRQHVQVARTAAERCAELTRGLLAFSRRLASDPKPAALKDVVDESELLLTRVLPATVRLETDVAPGLPEILIDAVQIQQVLLNLCVNARDAMPIGGKLRIVAREVHLSAGERRAASARPGRFVELSVADEGTGMTADLQSRIFEPFFTTKPVGEGTGLGLAMVYGIVTKHQGWVEVESAPREGSTFRVFLPVAAPHAATASAPVEAAQQGESECILVVDDEPAVRKLTVQVLARAGYQTLSAGDGDEALQVIVTHRGRIRVVVLDTIMPGMALEAIVRALREREPGARVVLSQGSPRIPLAETGTVAASLDKPYSVTELLAAVRRALAGDPATAR